jgi:spore maturation protein CgeB
MISSILYIGHLDKLSNSYRRFSTYKSLVTNIIGVDIDEYIYKSISVKFDHHLNFGIGSIHLNHKIKSLNAKDFDLVLVDNRQFLFPATIKKIKRDNPTIKIAAVLTDDFNGRYKRGWRLLKKTASLYDIHFVQRIQNFEELLKWGANRVEICYRSYDPNFHRKKPNITKNINFDAGFIGSYEEQREESIKYLIENGIKVQVIGDGWDKGKHFDLIKPFYGGASVYGELYVDSINSMQIALHFLRVGNRDEQDSRTFEIPACGTPMIAEHSSVHATLFNENEVLYFNTNEELLDKVRYYMENPQIAAEYAERAVKRCVESGYDHRNTLAAVLKKIEE